VSDSVLVTGAAGFIGFHVARRLLEDGRSVVGLDNLNEYYDPALKEARLEQLGEHAGFEFVKLDVRNRDLMRTLFEKRRFASIVHLAAQAGVRHSIDHPHEYVDTNLVGFLNVLEGARQQELDHLVFASSSSVYGANQAQPFDVGQGAGHPLSLYAATKRSSELMAHAYANLYGIPVTGLRYFTVYGPWGRPDMALWRFTEAILEGRPIDVHNRGDMQRTFTYVDDAVEATVRVLDEPASANPTWDGSDPDPSTSSAPFRLLNVGAGESVRLIRFIELIEEATGRHAQKRLLPMQRGDVRAATADLAALEALTGFTPSVDLAEGIRRFVDWYREHRQARAA